MTLLQAGRALWGFGGRLSDLGRGTLILALLAVGVAVTLLWFRIPVGPLTVAALCLLALFKVLQIAVPAAERSPLSRVVWVVFGSHVLVASALFAASKLAGGDGFYFGDDRAYDIVGRYVAEYVHGTGDPLIRPPAWGGYAYMLSTYGWVVAFVYTVFGQEALSVLILNSAFASVTVVFSYQLIRRLLPDTWAIPAVLLVGFFPSVFFWSVLNLKDALALALVMATLSAAVRLKERPHPFNLVTALAVLAPMEPLRHWLYYVLSGSLSGSVFVAPRLRWFGRVGWLVGTAATTIVIAEVLSPGVLSGTFKEGLLSKFAQVRYAMAAPAQSAFGGATPLPVVVEGGAVVIVSTPAPATSAQDAPQPIASPQVPESSIVVVSPGTRIVVAQHDRASAPPGAVVVQPGDRIVVVGSGTAKPDATQLVLRPEGGSVTLSTWEEVNRDVLETGAVGLVYALLAPFPWFVPSASYVPVVFDMLIWYTVVAGAAWSVIRKPARIWALTPLILYAAGTLVILGFVEGNLGTLLRHRAMVIPVMIVIASPALGEWAKRLIAVAPRRSLLGIHP